MRRRDMRIGWLAPALCALLLGHADGADVGKVLTKGWYDLSLVKGSVGYNATLECLSLNVGLPQPYGFGIGLTGFGGVMPVTADETVFQAGGPMLHLWWIPWIHWVEPGFIGNASPVGGPNAYLRYSILPISLGELLPSSELTAGVEMRLNWYISLGVEVGHAWSLRSGQTPGSAFYAGFSLGALRYLGPIGYRRSRGARLDVAAQLQDEDGNGVLTGDERSAIALLIRNLGDGPARDVVVTTRLSGEAGALVGVSPVGVIGNVTEGATRSVTSPIAVLGDLPRGNLTLEVVCDYKTEWGESRQERAALAMRTAPSVGMVKVALSAVPSQGLPDWIAVTPLEHADYQASFAAGAVTILNLNTGERVSQSVTSAAGAQQYVRQYFLGWDKAKPQITLSSSGGTVNTEAVKLKVRFSDDRKLDGMKLYLNGKEHDAEQFSERTETERDFTLPLLMGDNTVGVTVTDWVGKSAEKSISFIRIRGGTGTYETGPLPAGEAPPSLALDAAPLDGNNTIVGGREEGVKVTVTNNGKGVAKWVRVVLEGDEYLTRQWGSERNLEDIKPGESKTATFSLLMPTDLERRQAKLRVVVKEGRGYSPTEVPELTLNLVPAEKTATQVEVVEDVDHGVPEFGISRPTGNALVVGLSKYLSVTAPKYARSDASAFTQYASRAMGIGKVESLFDERATGSVLRAKLTDWLKKKHGFKVIYFAGHGVPDPENPRNGGVCVLPYDGDPELKSTLIPVSDLAELGANPDDTVVVFIDACYSGEGRTVQLASRPLVVAEVPETKAITFAAAEGNQPSKEFEKAQHGYFTYYTLLGLKGKADANGDGWVTTTELYNYVRKNVSDATNEVQVPVLRPAREIRLGKVR